MRRPGSREWLFIVLMNRSTIVLQAKVQHIRKSFPDLAGNCYAPSEISTTSGAQLLKASLTRPFVFLFTEPITYLSGAVNA